VLRNRKNREDKWQSNAWILERRFPKSHAANRKESDEDNRVEVLITRNFTDAEMTDFDNAIQARLDKKKELEADSRSDG